MGKAAAIGPLMEVRVSWLEHLASTGYSDSSIVQGGVLIDSLEAWLADHGLEFRAFAAADVRAFRRDCGWRSTGLIPLLRFARASALIPPEEQPAWQPLLDAFSEHLVRQRGLSGLTARTRCDVIRRFVRDLPEDLPISRLEPAQVHAFVRSEGERLASTSMAPLLDALRSFLSFAFLTDRIARDLGGCLPPVLTHRQPPAPRSVDPATVALLLAACNRSSEVGRRDYAVLLLLSRLGLRANEVAQLRLDDLHWRAGELEVRGKGRCLERLPLPDDVGGALADYLCSSHRPAGPDRVVFRQAVAPDGPLSRNGIVFIPRTASARAGIATVGAHQLRHTAATSMLAAGASLRDIGQVLRHEREQTTAIYASVAPERLRPLARPWPTEVTR